MEHMSLQQVQCLEGHTDRVWSVSFSPSGNYLASCSGDRSVRIWTKESEDSEKWICQTTLDESHTRSIRALDWSPCGRYLATAGFDSTTAIWENVGNGEFECIASLEGHENEVKSVCWNAEGNLLATCSRDKSIWIWEVEKGGGGAANDDFECISVLHGHKQDIKMVKFHPRSNILASASYDDTIKVWVEEEEGDDWHCVQTLAQDDKGHSSTVWAISFNSVGDKMVSCSDDLTLVVWDSSFDFSKEVYSNGKWFHLFTLSGFHSRTIYSTHWSSVNNLIASGSSDDSIQIFSLDWDERNKNNSQEGKSFELKMKKENAHNPEVNCVKWHPRDPRVIASVGDDCVIKIWKVLGTLPHTVETKISDEQDG